MCPGACVMTSGGLASRATACGVTPQAQKTRLLAGQERGRVAPVGLHDVGDADERRVAHVDGHAVGHRVASRHGHRPRHEGCGDGPHGNDHRPPEDAGRPAREVRPEHRDDPLLLDVPDGHTGLEERRLERERAAEEEGDEVVAPLARDVGHLGGEAAVAVDPVLRDVRPEVRARGDAGRLGVPGVRDLDQGARPGVSLAEDEEIVGLRPGQDDEVRLDVAGREPGGSARVASLADGLPDLLRRLPELHRVASSRVGVDVPAIMAHGRRPGNGRLPRPSVSPAAPLARGRCLRRRPRGGGRTPDSSGTQARRGRGRCQLDRPGARG